MNAKPYKLIFTLLIVSVLCVLFVQAIWIHNFYNQKKEEYTRTIYSALEQVSAKLYERENLQKVQQEIIINHSGTKSKPENYKVRRILSGSVNGRVITNSSNDGGVGLDSIKKIMDNLSAPESSTKMFRPALQGIYHIEEKRVNGIKSDVDKLMDKVIYEIRIMDTNLTNSDSIKNVIRRVLANKGLFMPFEFALKKVENNKTETLLKSPLFKENESAYISDLSVNKILSTHTFLFLQVPGEGEFVFASIKNMMLLSLLFSLIIIAVFYYTSRLILKQKKLSEVKNDFINNMTHELKTPIATISLATDAISNPQIKDNQEKFAEYTRILKEENQKLNTHVERVLQMAMLDKGDLQLNKRIVNLVPLVESAINSHKLQIQKQKATVNFLNRNEVWVEGDENHLQAVFNNLLDNALKYSKENCQVDITIAKTPQLVSIYVKDNGIGIDSDKKDKVFEKFYRVQGGNLHDVKGFGLGLGYVKSILEAHGGTIELQSEKEKGSTFIIKLKTDA